MAETFKNQVDALTGFAGTEDDALSDWLTAGAKEIINLLPDNLLYKCVSTSTLDNSTPTLTNMDTRGKIFSVIRGDGNISYPCRQVSSDKIGTATDPGLVSDVDDMFNYATSTSPVYAIKGNVLYVKPIPTSKDIAIVESVTYPAVAHGDGGSGISNFPDEAEYLVVLYAAIKALQRLMNAKRSSLPSVPALSLTAAPTISDLSLDSVLPPSPPEPSFTTPSIGAITVATTTLSNAGSAPVYVKPEEPTLSSNSITFNQTAPTYNTQAVAPDFADANTWLNTEEDSEMVSSRMSVIQGQLQDYQAKIQNELNIFNKENTEYQAQLQKAIQDAQLASTDDSQLLQKYQTDITNELNSFNKANAEYQVKLQEAIQQAQIDAGKASQQAQLDSQDAQQEASLLLQKETQEYANKLQKYSSAVSAYQAEVSKKVQEYQQNYQKEFQIWQTKRQTELQEHSSNLQKFSAEIQKETTDYQWYQSQQVKLQQDYNQGIQILIGGGSPSQQQGER